MKKLSKVAVNDFRLVFRDNSLKIFIILPVLNILVIRYGVPYVAGIFEVLNDYISFIMMAATVQGAIAFGFIYSMVFVDEKDTKVAKVYGILPVSKFWFTIFRFIAPFLLAALSTFLLLLFEPFYKLPIIPNLIFSTLTGLVSPLMILFVALLATNKIEAMTWQKLFNIPLYLPISAFFIPAFPTFVFAFLPTHWIYQTFDNLIKGESAALFLIAGFIHSLLFIGLMTRKFAKNHFA